MTYIGCMNGAGCVYAEGLSNTAVGALWSGGNADGFAQNYLGTCDMGSLDEPMVGSIHLDALRVAVEHLGGQRLR